MNWITTIPAVRMLCSKYGLTTCRTVVKGEILTFSEWSDLEKAGWSGSPERCLSVDPEQTSPDVLNELFQKWYLKNCIPPSVVWVRNEGIILVHDKQKQAGDYCVDARVAGRVVVVTGGAQGFGSGIAQELFLMGAHVVVADMNQEAGARMAEQLNGMGRSNKALFVAVDVSEAASVEKLLGEVVMELGGIDVFISNAGILRAGSLDEMNPTTFDLMTRVNYSGYFYCAKYASQVMKTQAEVDAGHYMDIIQINSKSGLKGSNRNFAYAGGKFGGIGLTQSFALELMPHHIKVNAICPGNFFDGPLWSDPQNGLFVQYLRAGKVPGAQTVEDVQRHYEQQVPAGRGCRVKDVVKAILYVIDQEYETGQAIPVTGGQEMLR